MTFVGFHVDSQVSFGGLKTTISCPGKNGRLRLDTALVTVFSSLPKPGLASWKNERKPPSWRYSHLRGARKTRRVVRGVPKMSPGFKKRHNTCALVIFMLTAALANVSFGRRSGAIVLNRKKGCKVQP